MKRRIINIAAATAMAFSKLMAQGVSAVLSPEEKDLVARARRIEQRKWKQEQRYRHVLAPHGKRERARRLRQIAAGSLRVENGLVVRNGGGLELLAA